MPSLTLVTVIAGCSIAGGLVLAAAQPAADPTSDGAITILSPLGGQEAIRLDLHKNKGMTNRSSGLPTHIFSSPNGAAPRSVTPFGTPSPPSLLTPAPLLPLQPKGMAMPYPQVPASSGLPNGGGSPSGRPGR